MLYNGEIILKKIYIIYYTVAKIRFFFVIIREPKYFFNQLEGRRCKYSSDKALNDSS